MSARVYAAFVAVLAFCAWCLPIGCSALARVTPADRAQGYASEAKAVGALCKAYRFDRAAVLVEEVPAMVELCK